MKLINLKITFLSLLLSWAIISMLSMAYGPEASVLSSYQEKVLEFQETPLKVCFLPENTPKSVEKYVKRFAETAILEQIRFGIPASISMAQALCESDAGKSRLARKADNHFGIKARKWHSGTIKADDDCEGLCTFASYDSAWESWRDHSKVLMADRYSAAHGTLDYKIWAYTLQDGGYATGKKYGHKLVKLIEKYHLHELDILAQH